MHLIHLRNPNRVRYCFWYVLMLVSRGFLSFINFPTCMWRIWYKRVHVDPQIREQEFGNFQDPGLTQKAQQGAKSPCFGSWVDVFVGAMCCIFFHGRSWKSCCFYRVGEVLPGKKKVAYFHIAASWEWMMVNRQVSRIKLNNCWRLTGVKILLASFGYSWAMVKFVVMSGCPTSSKVVNTFWHA